MFLFIFFLFFVFCFFLVFSGGFKGQVRWPEGPPHLALNPPSFFVFFGLFVCLFFFGELKGQVRWPYGFFLALSFMFFSFFPVLCFLSEKKPVFPLKKGHFCLFLSVSLCFSWAFFGLPLVKFLFLCLSLLFFSFFLPSCLSFLLSFGSFFFSLSFFFCLLCFCFMKSSNIKIFNCKVFSSILCLFLVFCLVFSLKSFFLIFVFLLIFSYVFCSTSMFLVSKNTSWKTPIFGQKGGCNKTFFLITCVLQNVKSYRFFCPFLGQILVDVQKTL